MKILVRCGILPYENVSVEEVIKFDSIGTNSGNLLYQYGVIKSLLTEETEIYSDRYEIDIENADFINENFDCYVLPLADAFRQDFIENLTMYTKLIKKLKIPVYVIGVGLRTTFEPQISGFYFDNEVKEFVSAVLDKSSCIGVRGHITSKYLSNLGFKEGKDHIAIGCPSMFSLGSDINIKTLDLNINSKVAINASIKTKEAVIKKIINFSDKFYSSYFIPQDYDELFLIYLGGPTINTKSEYFPSSYASKFYAEGNVKFFIGAKEWFEFMKNMDFSIGTRLHGNIAATLGGTPNLTIAIDSRMRELAEFHNLPYISEEEFSNLNSVDEILDKFDFNSPKTVHKQNFENFKNFLKVNNLQSIYDENQSNQSKFKKLMNNLNNENCIEPINRLNMDKILKRLEFGINFRKNKFEVSKDNWALYKKLKKSGIFN